jgi:hypothetical protein
MLLNVLSILKNFLNKFKLIEAHQLKQFVLRFIIGTLRFDGDDERLENVWINVFCELRAVIFLRTCFQLLRLVVAWHEESPN